MQRNLLIATALIVLSPVFLWAQPAGDTQPPPCSQGDVRGPGRGGPGEGMRLNLNDDQKAKLDELRTKHKAEAQALREKYKADVQAILTPEQAKVWSEMKKNRKHHRGGMGMHSGRSKRGAMRGKGMPGFGMTGQPMGTMGACPPMGSMGMAGPMGQGQMGPTYIIIIPAGTNPWCNNGYMMGQNQHFRYGKGHGDRGFNRKAQHHRRGKGMDGKRGSRRGANCDNQCPTGAPAAAPAAPVEEKK